MGTTQFKAYAVKLAEPVAGQSSVPARIQLMRCGNFSSEEYGKFKITPEILLSMVKNFQAKVRGYEDGKLPIDYFHKNSEEAAGWIDNVTVEGDALMADVTWTPVAEKKLADKELRYVSAEFHFDYQGNESPKKFGPTLLGAGLTNRPFIKGMDAVVELTEGDLMDPKDQEIESLKKVIEELKAQLAGKGGEAEMKEKMAGLEAKCAEYEASAKKAAEAAALAEKTGKFNVMLTEGKACEAQREAFMSGDVVAFAERAKPVKLSSAGNEGGAGEGGTGKTAVAEVEEKVMAEMAAKKISFSQAVQSVLLSDAGLRARYDAETQVQ